MNDLDLGWLAGIVEGEGSITRTKTSGGRRYPRLRVKMADEEIVARVARLFGRTYVPSPDASRAAHHRDQWETSIKGRPALELLERLRPHLGARRRSQIDAVVAG